MSVEQYDIQEVASNALLTSRKWGMSDQYSQDVIEQVLRLA